MITRLPAQFALLGVLCLPLAAQLSVPKVGTFRYPDGSLHSVQGLSANMIVFDLPVDSSQAASFSDYGGLVSQSGVIRLLGADFSVLGEYQAAGDDGNAKPVVGISGDLTSALAWLPASHTLLHWNGSQFDALELAAGEIEGEVTDVECVALRQARLLVLHQDGSVSAVTFSLRTGGLVNSELLPGVRGHAFNQGFLVLYATDRELVVDNLNTYRRSVAFPAPDVVMERMSNSWVHLYSAKLQQHWAVHLTLSEFEVSMLPGQKSSPPVTTTKDLGAGK